MSDHDRGAYTPQRDAPLSFDPRQSLGGGGFPTSLLVGLLILLGLGVGIVMVYRSGVRAPGAAPAAVGAPVGDIKAPPPADQDAKPRVPVEGQSAYRAESGGSDADRAGGRTATFAPPPEQPLPHAAPTTPVAAQPIGPAIAAPTAPPSPMAVAASGATSQPAPPPPAAASPPPIHTVAATAAKKAAEPASGASRAAAASARRDDIDNLLSAPGAPNAAAAKSPAHKPAKTAPATAASAAHGGANLVQIGAYSSAALAGREWSKLATAHRTDLKGKGEVIEPVRRGAKTLYRASVSGFRSHAAAVAFCAKLKAAGKACLVR